MFNWKPFASAASESDVDHLENHLGIILPRYYKDYLLSSNGGQPDSDVVFQLEHWRECIMLGCMYGICKGDPGIDIETIYDESKNELPTGFFPIGEDPGGNFLLLGASGEIHYWDKAGFLEKRFGKSLFLVAKDIKEFLSSLKVGPE